MHYEATLTYTAPLLRKAVLAFWRRTSGWGFPAALIVGALCLGFLVVQGDDSWIVGVLGSALFFGVVFVAGLYLVHCRATLGKLRDMGAPHATFRAEASSFTLVSGLGTVTYEWSAIKEIWQFPEVWLLLFSPAQFSTLPVECLQPEMQAYVLERVRAAGGRIVNG